jgi:hypothetical protein
MAKVDDQKSDQLVLGKFQHEIDNSDLFTLTNYSVKELIVKKASMVFLGMFASAVFYFGMSG